MLGSAVISGTEVAFFSLSHKQITQCKNSQDLRDSKIFKLLQDPIRLLATVLILNNLINISFITLSTYLLWKIVDIESADGLIMFAYTCISTTLIVLFGEVIPKIYANQNNARFAKRMTRFLAIAVLILYPLSGLLLRISKLFGNGFFQEKYDLSIDKLSRALELTTIRETSEEERETLKGVVNFSSLTAKQIMQPRMEITAVDRSINFHQLITLINQSGYSRFPVYKETIDKIEGILYTKDLLAHLDKEAGFPWHSLLRKCLFIPENKKIDALLLELQEKRLQMTLVVDEYGGTAGLITLEDIIEEIIGDISDEFNQDEVMYQQLDDQNFVFESKISLNDFCKVIGEKPSTFSQVKGENESLGGLLLELNGHLPRANEKLYFQQFTFTVIAADTRKLKKIKVKIAPDKNRHTKNGVIKSL